MKNSYTIVYDAFQEAKWFQGLNKAFKGAKLVTIDLVKNKPEIDRVIRYDRPDIILIRENRVVLGLEKTTEVPTGHNIGQRFARIVCAAEERIPFIYFLPFAVMKHGKYASVCWINARLLVALKKLSQIHKVPILAVNWKSDDKYELIRDGTQDIFLKEIIGQFIDHDFKHKIPILTEVYQEMDKAYNESLKKYPKYASPPETLILTKTTKYLTDLKRKFGKTIKLPLHFLKRRETILYKIGMKYVRADPYTGMQLIYDYLLARAGITPKERNRNLVLQMLNISNEMWRKVANKKERKDIKIYTLFSDLIELKDAIII